MGVLTVQNILDRVRIQTSDAAGLLMTDAAVFNWINDGMREIVLDNDLLKIRSTSNSVVGQSNYGLPSDILRMHSLSFDGQAIEEITLQEARRTIPDIDKAASFARGTPQQFWLYGSEFFLYPAPTTVASLTLYYNRNPVLITAVGNIPELPARYDNRIVEYCLAQAAELDNDSATADRKLSQFSDGLEKARDEETESGMYPHMGVSMADAAGYSYTEN